MEDQQNQPEEVYAIAQILPGGPYKVHRLHEYRLSPVEGNPDLCIIVFEDLYLGDSPSAPHSRTFRTHGSRVIGAANKKDIFNDKEEAEKEHFRRALRGEM